MSDMAEYPTAAALMPGLEDHDQTGSLSLAREGKFVLKYFLLREAGRAEKSRRRQLLLARRMTPRPVQHTRGSN